MYNNLLQLGIYEQILISSISDYVSSSTAHFRLRQHRRGIEANCSCTPTSPGEGEADSPILFAPPCFACTDPDIALQRGTDNQWQRPLFGAAVASMARDSPKAIFHSISISTLGSKKTRPVGEVVLPQDATLQSSFEDW